MVNKDNIILLLQAISDLINHDARFMLDPYLDGIIKEEDYSKFVKQVKELKSILNEDLEFFLKCDPAVNSSEEVRYVYPGYKAIMIHRVAHILFKMNYKVEARVMSEYAHQITGIDIHPGATISYPFFIDHGTGIVIGETAVIGKRVRIYQGVTLGALSLAKGSALKGTKRHPTILDDVIIYSGASILGDITIGNNVTIGSNVFLLKSIPDNRKVTLPEPILVINEK